MALRGKSRLSTKRTVPCRGLGAPMAMILHGAYLETYLCLVESLRINVMEVELSRRSDWELVFHIVPRYANSCVEKPNNNKNDNNNSIADKKV